MKHQRIIAETTLVPAVPQSSGYVLQRKCACGQHTVAGGGCAEGSRKGLLQRNAASGQGMNEVPPIVHDVLRSPGQPLNAHTRPIMEPPSHHPLSPVPVP